MGWRIPQKKARVSSPFTSKKTVVYLLSTMPSVKKTGEEYERDRVNQNSESLRHAD